MIKTPGPVDPPLHESPDIQRTIKHMHHLIVFVVHVEHGRAAQRANVMRLTAGGRIKRRLVEDDSRVAAILITTDNVAGEGLKEGVGVIQTLHEWGNEGMRE
ncbi:MAG: hypothetical protein AMXMBFR57_19940 [Acidimicrobiia bacterium]